MHKLLETNHNFFFKFISLKNSHPETNAPVVICFESVTIVSQHNLKIHSLTINI